jgi:hypothetical protein
MNEYPLMFAPSLAVLLGVHEAIFLQQLHYWLEKSKHEKEGFTWVYNTYEEWQVQFPFWSTRTIRRTVKSLEEQKIVITASFNKMKIDKTKWYRIDYDRLDKMDSPCGQVGQSNSPSWPVEAANLSTPLPETTTETTPIKDLSRKRVYDADSLEYKIALFFYQQILKNNSKHKEPNLQKWANDIRLLLEIDKRDKTEVGRVIQWAMKDTFWMANILSPKKLREKYDALVIKMNQEKANGPKDKPAPKSNEVKEFEMDITRGE